MTSPVEPHEYWGRLLAGVGTRKDAEDAVLHLRAVLMEVMPPGSPSCAVQEHNGRRTLAATLISYAASFDVGHDKRSPADDASADLRRIRDRARHPAAARRGAGRRVE